MHLWILWEPAVWRMLARRLTYSLKGFVRYSGDAQRICKCITHRCFNGHYLQVSSGHFQNFYCRDFAICVPALLNLGHHSYVMRTLHYALRIFAYHDKICTTINSRGQPHDFFDYGIDSLPFLLRALRQASEHQNTASAANSLLSRYSAFLEGQIQIFTSYIDMRSGLVRADVRLSTMKDHMNRPSSCYANCMAGMLAHECKLLGLHNPLADFDYGKLLMDHFYNGRFFLDHQDAKQYVAGDANTFPFYCGIIEDKHIFLSCLAAIRGAGLDSPFPLKYTNRPTTEVRMNILPSLLAPNYEGTTIWMHLGLCFLYMIRRYVPKNLPDYLDAYTQHIEQYANFLEVFNPDGTPYRAPFYVADESMSWAVMYLDLVNKRNQKNTHFLGR
ncbi:MAG: hypothetical protein ACOCWQ_04325 [Nanoarchaeota archaeon]